MPLGRKHSADSFQPSFPKCPAYDQRSVPNLLLSGLMWAWLARQVDSAGFTAALGAANRLNAGVSLASAWGVETILTCLLVFTVLAATDGQRGKETAHLPVNLAACHDHTDGQ